MATLESNFWIPNDLLTQTYGGRTPRRSVDRKPTFLLRFEFKWSINRQVKPRLRVH